MSCPLKPAITATSDRSPQREDPRLGTASPVRSWGHVRRPEWGRQQKGLTNTLSNEEHDGGDAHVPRLERRARPCVNPPDSFV